MSNSVNTAYVVEPMDVNESELVPVKVPRKAKQARRDSPSATPAPHVHPEHPGVLCPAPVVKRGEFVLCDRPVLYGSSYCDKPTHQKHDDSNRLEKLEYEVRKSRVDQYLKYQLKTATAALQYDFLRSQSHRVDHSVKGYLDSVMPKAPDVSEVPD